MNAVIEITRKPTPRMVEAMRTGLTNPQGVIEPSADKRTHEGLVGRGMADWVQPGELGRDVWGVALCVITKKGREYLAKLDAAAEEAKPAPAKARRGDMVMVELRPTYATQKPGDSVTSGHVSDFRLMTVRGLTRGGEIRTVSDDRWGSGDYQGREERFEGMLHRTGAYSLLPASMWNLGEALEIARKHTYPKSTTPRGFESMEAARTALAPARLGASVSAVEAPMVVASLTRPLSALLRSVANTHEVAPGKGWMLPKKTTTAQGAALVRRGLATATSSVSWVLTEKGVAVAEEVAGIPWRRAAVAAFRGGMNAVVAAVGTPARVEALRVAAGLLRAFDESGAENDVPADVRRVLEQLGRAGDARLPRLVERAVRAWSAEHPQEAVSASVGASEAPMAPVGPVAAESAVSAVPAPVEREFASMGDAVAFLGSLRVGDRVRVTQGGRTGDYGVSMPARRSGSQGTVKVTVSLGPGRYAFEVSAGDLFAQRGDKATMTLGGTRMVRLDG
ncbi:hypothetical protein [Streptomyces sp. NPDC088727]|uniref:hypothetical protein n=1 Tax=Streptomyces sp. NPDC088727 TaxID=3365875 RepID=UPI0037F8B2D1